MMLHTKYQGSMPYDFRQEYFFRFFPNISLCKACHSLGGAILGPKDKSGRGPLGDATYQISRL